MQLVLRMLTALIALLLGAIGLGFMFDPLAGAVRFGLQADGIVGLNTLRGDLGGMFLGSAVLVGIGLVRREAAWLLAVAVVMAAIVFGRLVGFVFDGFAGNNLPAFGLEILFVVVLVAAARSATR